MKSNSKKKILFILHYPPPIHGAAMMGNQIKNSKIVNNTFQTKYINLGISIDVDEIGKNSFTKIFRYLQMIINVYNHLYSFRPNLCYLTPTAHGIGLYKDIPIILLIKLFNIKLVYHFHNKGVKNNENKFIDDLIYRWMFNNANVILLSKYLYSDIKKYVSEQKIYYCINGIPDLNSNPNIEINKSNDNIKILFLSNLIESKGINILLKSCQKLKQKKLNFNCTFVGDIGDFTEEKFNRFANQLNILDVVHYAGKKYNQSKVLEFKNADIFVHPTLEDCVPLVILEAMQYSLPIISTFEGGVPDLIIDGKTGYIVPKNNVDDLVEKIEKLIKSSKLREKLGRASRKKYESEYTLSHFEQNMTEILTKIR